MKLEKFRTFDGILIRAVDEKDRALFEHCAGDTTVHIRNEEKLHAVLFIHGVAGICTVHHHSIEKGYANNN